MNSFSWRYYVALLSALLTQVASGQTVAPILVSGNSTPSGTVTGLLAPVAAKNKQLAVVGEIRPIGGTDKYALIKIRNGQRSVMALSMQPVVGQTYQLYDFSYGTSPTINAQGTVLFNADYYYSDSSHAAGQGLFQASETPGVITKFLHDGDPAADGNGLLDVALSNRPAMTQNGRIAYAATVYNAVGGLGNGSAIYSSVGGSSTRIVRTGQIPPSGTSYFTGFTWPTINEDGQVAFLGVINNGTFAIYKGNGAALTEIARTGQTFAPNWTIRDLTPVDGVPINKRGDVAFRAKINQTGADAILIGNGGNLQILAYGGQVPTSGLGTVPLTLTRHVSLNDSGQVVFQGSYVNGYDGIFRAQQGSLISIARADGPVPGTVSGTFTTIVGHPHALNKRGDVAFTAQFQNGGQATLGLFYYSDETGLLPAVVEYGTPMAGGIVNSISFLGNTSNAFRSGGSSGLDENGDLSFRFGLTNGVVGIATFSPRSILFTDGFE